MREIEIKLRVENLKELENKLKEKGVNLSVPIRQHDIIYSKKGSINEWESAKEGDIILRIRRQNINGNEIVEFNLKQQCSNEMDNIEYETEIKDANATYNILNILGWAPQIEVKKMRRKGKLGDCEICLDEVDELGNFIEFEKIVDNNANPEKVREDLFKIAESIGLSQKDEETRGYDTQIYQLHK